MKTFVYSVFESPRAKHPTFRVRVMRIHNGKIVFDKTSTQTFMSAGQIAREILLENKQIKEDWFLTYENAGATFSKPIDDRVGKRMVVLFQV